eukprot:1605828-Rhodomonas_salina.1
MNTKERVVGIVDGAWHSPFRADGGAAFLAQLTAMLQNAQVPNPSHSLTEALAGLDPAEF